MTKSRSSPLEDWSALLMLWLGAEQKVELTGLREMRDNLAELRYNPAFDGIFG